MHLVTKGQVDNKTKSNNLKRIPDMNSALAMQRHCELSGYQISPPFTELIFNSTHFGKCTFAGDVPAAVVEGYRIEVVLDADDVLFRVL